MMISRCRGRWIIFSAKNQIYYRTAVTRLRYHGNKLMAFALVSKSLLRPTLHHPNTFNLQER